MSSDLNRLLREYHGDTDRLLAEFDMRRTATIRRTGNAEAVTIPKKWLQELSWKEGDSLLLHLDKSMGTITLQKPKLCEK
jgi:hypothetical protein